MRVARKKVPGPGHEPMELSHHEYFRQRFGDQFGILIARPITAIQRITRAHGLSVREATTMLKHRALELYPERSVLVIGWLDAACTELLKGTPIE